MQTVAERTGKYENGYWKPRCRAEMGEAEAKLSQKNLSTVSS